MPISFHRRRSAAGFQSVHRVLVAVSLLLVNCCFGRKIAHKMIRPERHANSKNHYKTRPKRDLAEAMRGK